MKRENVQHELSAMNIANKQFEKAITIVKRVAQLVLRSPSTKGSCTLAQLCHVYCATCLKDALDNSTTFSSSWWPKYKHRLLKTRQRRADRSRLVTVQVDCSFLLFVQLLVNPLNVLHGPRCIWVKVTRRSISKLMFVARGDSELGIDQTIRALD